MKLKRTTEETIARIGAVAQKDVDGSERSRLLESLPWDAAKVYLTGKHEHTESSWTNDVRTTAEADVVEDVADLIGHAWLKANRRRGTSVGRVRASFRGSFWLLADRRGADGTPASEVLAFLEGDDAASYYGKAALVRVSEYLGRNWRYDDDGRWVMADGDEPLSADAALASV